MASTDQKPDVEAAKPTAPRPPPPPPGAIIFSGIDVGLRVLLFAATLVALVVMVTSKQTELAVLPVGFRVPLTAKFNHSPAFIYFVVAMSVACLYSILTTLASLGFIRKPAPASKFLPHFVFLDLLMLGIVSSATGAAAAVAYIGLRGNSHVGWNKVCPVFDKFCRHIGSSVAISLFASILLVFLTLLSVVSLHRRIPGLSSLASSSHAIAKNKAFESFFTSACFCVQGKGGNCVPNLKNTYFWSKRKVTSLDSNLVRQSAVKGSLKIRDY